MARIDNVHSQVYHLHLLITQLIIAVVQREVEVASFLIILNWESVPTFGDKNEFQMHMCSVTRPIPAVQDKVPIWKLESGIGLSCMGFDMNENWDMNSNQFHDRNTKSANKWSDQLACYFSTSILLIHGTDSAILTSYYQLRCFWSA